MAEFVGVEVLYHFAGAGKMLIQMGVEAFELVSCPVGWCHGEVFAIFAFSGFE